MVVILLPFFMPLFLLGWVLDTDDERALAKEEARRERDFGATWGVHFAREA
ncbi:hypothetical protein G6O69_08095 [Pseudenhygromyxa sp. WMMC2535]|uniref:hypothetical protein n=1 Tax=Pseudenhygromyxa sp. WMMC2535 TaxID=2712867 RepID=UPI001552981F|nr:hypothetical protein [Pseudenhygromyxa sp. WMMC2535]NVB37791.1 hypothetical protein [Pseudenhygromyxa sp. WMMC2535]